jgi:hypothetical protein
MKQTQNRIPWWRTMLLIPLAVMGVASIVATGGGEEEEVFDEEPEGPPTIPPVLNFLLSSLQGGTPLTLSEGSGVTVSVNFTDIVFGTVNLTVDADNAVTFSSYATRNTDGLEITVGGTDDPALDGTFSFVVMPTDPINTNIGENPNSGTFEVVTVTETVTVTILNAGVEISLNGGMALAYTWDEFTDLLIDDMLPAWQRRASLAGGAYELINELALTVADTLDELEAVALTNPIIEDCDMFSGAPPAGVLAQGETTITWLGSGAEIMPGDNFDWVFTDCWDDESLDNSDDLIHGAINLDNYAETVDTVTNTLFEIGFGGLTTNSPGGVIFDNLKVSETVENMGVFTIDTNDDLTINGGFTLILQEF